MARFFSVMLLVLTWYASANNTQVIDDVANIVEAQFVSEKIAAEVAEALRQPHFKSTMSTIKDPKEFAKRLTDALRTMSGDNHIGIVFSSDDVQRYRIREQAKTNATAQKQQAANKASELAASASANFGIQQVRLLDGDVGYLEMSYFDGFVDESAPVFAAAMNMLASSKIIILDLRRNGGGNSRVLPLFLSYFLGPEPVHFATKSERWNNSSEKLFTTSNVQGHRHFNKPIYILTSGTTFSLAEHVTYHLRAFNRAIVIGERTYGGGKAFDPIVVSDDFYLRMPRVDLVNARTKTMYKEGQGIAPDVATTAQAAYHQAYLLALTSLENQEQNAAQKDYYQWVKRIVSAQAPPEQTHHSLPQFKTRHRFADFEFEVRQNELWLSFRKLPWVKLINLGNGYFYDDRSIQRQFSFVKESNGFQLKVYRAGESPVFINEVVDDSIP